MAANSFSRYVWLVDLLRRYKALSFEEINEKWVNSPLSYGEDDKLSAKTFHNHRRIIFDIFNIDIIVDKNRRGYKYIIDKPEQLENDKFRTWLLDSYATLNLIQVNQKLQGRIQFEEIPSGHEWLPTLLEAMQNNQQLHIKYRRFQENKETDFTFEPYFLKVFSRRWYIIGRKLPCTYYTTYSLDRIKAIEILPTTFTLPEDCKPEEHFKDSFGIFKQPDIEVEHIEIKVFGTHRYYLESLPLHASQVMKESCEDYTVFAYEVRPTLDFYQELFKQMNWVEILSPQNVRDTYLDLLENMRQIYFPTEEKNIKNQKEPGEQREEKNQ